MAQMIVRNLEEEVRNRLRERAREHGRSMEAEAREILRAAVMGTREERPGIGTMISECFAEHALEDGDIRELRGESPRPADLGE